MYKISLTGRQAGVVVNNLVAKRIRSVEKHFKEMAQREILEINPLPTEDIQDLIREQYAAATTKYSENWREIESGAISFLETEYLIKDLDIAKFRVFLKGWNLKSEIPDILQILHENGIEDYEFEYFETEREKTIEVQKTEAAE